MTKGKKIYFNNRPKLPITSTMLIAFLLYYFQVNMFIIGVASILGLIIWISAIVLMTKSKEISIDEMIEAVDKMIEEENAPTSQTKSNFQQRLEQLAKEKGIKYKE